MHEATWGELAANQQATVGCTICQHVCPFARTPAALTEYAAPTKPQSESPHFTFPCLPLPPCCSYLTLASAAQAARVIEQLSDTQVRWKAALLATHWAG